MNMRIGELAKSTGCQPETVRFYEQKGLLPEPSRSQANYRLYDASHVDRLHFIRRCRALGMSLDEVQSLLGFQDQPDRPCGAVNDLVDRHIVEIDRQIADLRTLHAELSELRRKCDSTRPAGQCEILKQLSETGPVRPSCASAVLATATANASLQTQLSESSPQTGGPSTARDDSSELSGGEVKKADKAAGTLTIKHEPPAQRQHARDDQV
jgi:Cd(II)/Pb(II)-responsive transcriptional regulator